MAPRYIPLQVDLPDDHPALLNGLDTWLRLGLLSDRQVRQLCKQYLVSPIPVVESALSLSSAAAAEPQIQIPEPSGSTQSSVPPTVAAAPAQGWVSQSLQRLINEVSVIWLLCLGVFLVVISSGVLAATQWQNFSPAGQYGILLAYTLAFVTIGLWTGTQQQLQLTSSMLQMTSLLIIPVNFWMMDGFKLLQTSGGIGIAAVASLLLSVATVRLLPRPRTSVLAIANILGLSWLHWGWNESWTSVPLLATYVGCIGTSLVLLRQNRSQNGSGRTPSSPESLSAEALDSGTTGLEIIRSSAEISAESSAISPSWLSRLAPADVLLPFAVLLLLFRACVVVKVPLDQLGLAFGICGWLLCWLARNNAAQRFWAVVGVGLLGIGWAAGLGAVTPWQSVLTGGLGLWLLSDRLIRHRKSFDLVALEVVGLMTVGLGVLLIPSALRTAITHVCTTWAGLQGMPDVLWSVGLYPYLWAMLALTFWLRRWQQSNLVRVGYGTAWILGGLLTVASSVNPVLRSFSLWLAFLTLVVALRQRKVTAWLPTERVLTGVLQGLGLCAVFSTVDNIASGLAVYHWGTVAIGLMALEWATLPFLTQRSLWKESVWYTGLGLAGLGYLLMLTTVGNALTPWQWQSVTLLTPTALTALLFLPAFQWRTQAIIAGTISTVVVQFLTFDAAAPRLVGLALGAVLMFLMTTQRPNLLTAALSVGFGLTLGYAAGWEGLPHQFQQWIMLSTGLLLALFGLRQIFSGEQPFNQPMRQAVDGWAITLTLWTTIPLTLYSLLTTPLPPGWLPRLTWAYPASSFVILGAWLYRLKQKPTQFWLVGTAWTAEVALVCTFAFAHQPLRAIAIATLSLGILTVLLGESHVRRTGEPYRWGWNLIPLGYGAFGWLLSLEWSETSGLYTLVFASIALGVGRRQPRWMPVTILGLLGCSTGAFELLLYPLLRAQGGQPGDGFLALGALGIAIALLSRGIDSWGNGVLNLPAGSLSRFGHLHWAIGSLFAMIALGLPLSAVGERLCGVELVVLGGYALFQGRPTDRPQANVQSNLLRQRDLWIYLSLSQIFAAVGQELHASIPETQLLPWASAITSAASLGLYSLPWPRWGWPRSPFYHFALAVPLAVTLLTLFSVNISSLLLTGGFYGWMALAAQTVRLSYVGLLAANWAALRLLTELHLTSRIWGISLVGLSLLFIAQIDPALRSTSRKELRHWLRCFAVGLIGTTVLYESDPHFWAGLLAIGLSLGLVLMGLLLRVRAFLYVGTLTFVAKILRLVWLFVANESLVLWALGIALGLLLIWVAATFEARRTQVTALLQYWVTELDQWE